MLPPPPPPPKLPEIRIRVVALRRFFNTRSTDQLPLVDAEESTFLGSGWRIESCGALTILDEAGKPTYAYAPGRWIEVHEDPED